MDIHPARSLAFVDLVASLEAAISAGAVKVVRDAARPALALYCYTQRAVYDNLWTPTVEAARGLVLDHGAMCVRATPFPKFFNYGERGLSLPDESFEVFDKLDGSLGVVWHDGDRWRVSTKGAFASPQAQWAQAWLDARDLSPLRVGATYCFEIIYAANRIVVRYPWEGMVLLAAYDADGREFTRAAVGSTADALGTLACGRYVYPSVEALVDAARTFASDREGFVVRFASGHRVKIKGAEYLRVHRLVSRVTPLALWDAMLASDDLGAIRREIPEEFYADFDAIRDILASHADAVRNAVEAEHERWSGASDKDVGLALKTLAEPARSLIFARRKGGATWLDNPKTRRSLYQHFRPTSNALAGYTPSAAIARLEDAA